jgi:hypothetical protein
VPPSFISRLAATGNAANCAATTVSALTKPGFTDRFLTSDWKAENYALPTLASLKPDRQKIFCSIQRCHRHAMCKSKQLRKDINKLLAELEQREKETFEHSDIKMTAKSARLYGLTSKLAEITTRRIIWLTWGLIALTVGLLAYTILIYQDAHKNAQSNSPTYQHGTNQP